MQDRSPKALTTSAEIASSETARQWMMNSERLVTTRTAGVLALVLLIGLVSCLRQPQSNAGDLTQCLRGYHAATPDPMPADGLASSFALGATYATPCGALSPSGEMRWTVLVVAPNDKTVRAYFIGGKLQDRCGLLRDVSVSETASAVTVQLGSGADTSAKAAPRLARNMLPNSLSRWRSRVGRYWDQTPRASSNI
jgi:hypothetical protein